MRFTAVLSTLLSATALARPSTEDKHHEVAHHAAPHHSEHHAVADMSPVPANVIKDLDLKAKSVSMMVGCPKWTIRHLSRKCNNRDSECKWEFYIDTGDDRSTACKFTVKGEHAHRKETRFHRCGCFSISTGYSPGDCNNPFTVLSVIDYQHGLIVWPGYTEKQLFHGQTVCPDQAYDVARIPGCKK